MFMSIRRAASCCHPRQEISVPRGARTVRGRAVGARVVVMVGILLGRRNPDLRHRILAMKSALLAGLLLLSFLSPIQAATLDDEVQSFLQIPAVAGREDAAAQVESAVDRALDAGLRTRDLGGNDTTADAARAVLEELK